MKPYCTGPNQWHVELKGGTVVSGFKDSLSVAKYIRDYKHKEIELEDLL